MKPLHEGGQSLPTARIAAQKPKVGALLCWQCFQSINYLILFESLLAINSQPCLTFNNILIVTVVFFSTPTPITRFASPPSFQLCSRSLPLCSLTYFAIALPEKHIYLVSSQLHYSHESPKRFLVYSAKFCSH
jgi:hypothetical protein